MAKFQPISVALEAGLTREVGAEGGCYSLLLLVSPDADLDSTFRAFDVDQGEFINVNGWLFDIEDATGDVMMNA
ncbi:MAG: hypothetical protein V4696_03915 [Pseudomonadota bacterium]